MFSLYVTINFLSVVLLLPKQYETTVVLVRMLCSAHWRCLWAFIQSFLHFLHKFLVTLHPGNIFFLNLEHVNDLYICHVFSWSFLRGVDSICTHDLRNIKWFISYTSYLVRVRYSNIFIEL